MRQISFCALLIALLSACTTPTAEQLAASAQVVEATGVQLTLQAFPTNTQNPTATETPTLFPSATPTETSIQTAAITETVPGVSGTQINALPTELSATEKADKSDNSTVVLLQNNTDEVIWLIIDGPTYFEYRFSDSFTILLPLGEYHYRVWIGDKGPIEGTFRIGNHDKHTMIFSPGKVQFQGP